MRNCGIRNQLLIYAKENGYDVKFTVTKALNDNKVEMICNGKRYFSYIGDQNVHIVQENLLSDYFDDLNILDQVNRDIINKKIKASKRCQRSPFAKSKGFKDGRFKKIY